MFFSIWHLVLRVWNESCKLLLLQSEKCEKGGRVWICLSLVIEHGNSQGPVTEKSECILKIGEGDQALATAQTS